MLYTDNHRPLGQMLLNIRKSLKLSQREAAMRLGVTTKEVSLFEHDLPVQLGAKIRILKQVYYENTKEP